MNELRQILENPDLLEELAELEHERWSGQAIAALTDMTDARRERWTRQARMLYAGLSDAEKEQDRKQVRKTLDAIAAWNTRQTQGGESK